MKQPRKRIRSRKQSARTTQSAASISVNETMDAEILSEEHEAQWASTRHGATAGRGFHYQDVVAAWYAAQLLVSDQHTRIVPESHREDLSCEGIDALEVQAKSRQSRVGLFPASKVAETIQTLHARGARNHGSRVELVIERDIREMPLPSEVVRLGDLAPAHPLFIACEAGVKSQSDPILDYLDIRVRVLSFSAARHGIAEVVQSVFQVDPATAGRIATDFIQLISDAADANAEVEYSHRHGVDRTALELTAQQAIAEIDPSSLIAAIKSGACEPVDLDTPDNDASYFQGLDAQPGHIAAGLPAPRHDEVDAVCAGLAVSQSVLIAGPSGAGKSTVLWMTAHVERHITWYRLNRLLADDVEDVYRFAQGRKPTLAAPLGFLVDGVGIAEMGAWDRLIRRLRPLQNVSLIGTVRIEDLFAVTTADRAVRVDIGLDENVAERIYEHLRRNGLTLDVHWREAFEDSQGLTLEYTYQLTQGHRLPAVLGGQVGRMVRDSAHNELEVLALVSTAHIYGFSLSIETAQKAAGLDSDALRQAIAHLKDEHLVVQDSDMLRGLHLHRSRALIQAMTDNPPPTKAMTITRLAENVAESDLPRLVVGALRDTRNIDDAIVTLAAARASTGSSDLLGPLLHAFRAMDFVRHAELCARIVTQTGVPPAHWPLAVHSGLTGVDLPKDLLLPSIADALHQLDAHRSESPILRNDFVQAVGPHAIVATALSQQHPAALASLLAGCIGVDHGTIDALVAGDWTGSNAEAVLQQSTCNEYASIGHIAGQLSMPLANKLLRHAGGESHIVERLFEGFPTVYQAGREQHDGQEMAVAKLMYIDDEVTPDPNTRAHDVAKVLLRSLPGCAQASISTIRAGGKPFQIGDLQFGESRLLGQYALTSNEVDWNRARTAMVIHELGTMSKARHASETVGLLNRAHAYLSVLASKWLGRGLTESSSYWQESEPERSGILNDANELSIPQDGLALFRDIIPGTGRRVSALLSGSFEDAQMPSVLETDSAHSVLQGITVQIPTSIRAGEPGRLAAQAATLVEALDKAGTSEHWTLAGLDVVPPAVADLRNLLSDIADIALALDHGVIAGDVLRRERSGPKGQFVQRVAEVAQRRIQDASNRLIEDLDQDLRSLGISAHVLSRPAAIDQFYWPRIDLAVIVQNQHVLEWAENAENVLQAVIRMREGNHLPRTLVCPEFNGQVEPSMGYEVITTAFASSDGYFKWFPDKVDVQESSTLRSEIARANDFLVRCSSLNELRTRRSLTNEYEDCYEQAVDGFFEALARIESMGDDECLRAIVYELSQLARSLDDESAEDGSPGTFAEHAFDWVTGQPSSEDSEIARTLTLLGLTATQWMHDPQTAIELFGFEIDVEEQTGSVQE